MIIPIRWSLVVLAARLKRTGSTILRRYTTRWSDEASRWLATIYYSLAQINRSNGAQEQALRGLQKALDLSPGYTPPAHELVNFYVAQGELALACRFAERTIRANPCDTVMRLKLGDIFMVWDMIEEAVDEWENAVKTDVDTVVTYRLESFRFGLRNAPAHFTLGLAFLSKGEPEKATNGFRNAAALTDNRILKHLAEERIQALQPEGDVHAPDA